MVLLKFIERLVTLPENKRLFLDFGVDPLDLHIKIKYIKMVYGFFLIKHLGDGYNVFGVDAFAYTIGI